jgi:hypothetical protein
MGDLLILALSGFVTAIGRILSHSTRPLNVLPTADLGELRDPVLAVPAV